MPTKITQNGRKKINVGGIIHSNSQEVALVGHTHSTNDINGLDSKISNAIDRNNSTVRSIVNNTIYENLKNDKNTYTYIDNDPKDGERGSKIYTLLSNFKSSNWETEYYHIVLSIKGVTKDLYVGLDGTRHEVIHTNINIIDDLVNFEFSHYIVSYSSEDYNRYFVHIYGDAKVLSITHFGYIDLSTSKSKDNTGYANEINLPVKPKWTPIQNDTGYRFMYEKTTDAKQFEIAYDIQNPDPKVHDKIISIVHFPNEGFIVHGLNTWIIRYDASGITSGDIITTGDDIIGLYVNEGSITYLFAKEELSLNNGYILAYTDKQPFDIARQIGYPMGSSHTRDSDSNAEKLKKIVFLINKYILKTIKEEPVLPDLKGRINGVLFTGKQDINITVPSLSTNHTINGVAFNGTQDITITARAAGGNADTLGNLNADQYIKVTDVANAAGKIPRFNAAGHLVYPDGHEEWIE